MKNGKPRYEIDNNSVYAVSDGNVVCKATTIGFYKLKRENNDFYYDGKTSFSTSNNNTAAIAGAAMFGLIGGMLASSTTVNLDLFHFKINYRKGNSIPISKVEKKK
jgi:hypothetical protein